MADTTAPARSAAALVLLAGDAVDAAGLDADAIALSLDAADASDSRYTYGANYHDAIRGIVRRLNATADRLVGTTVRVNGRAITTTVTRTVGARGVTIPNPHAATANTLYRLATDLTLVILSR